MPLTISTFTIPAASDVPAAIREAYVIGSFPTAVRDWHLERLPRFTIAGGTYITCPWCGKSKDQRSTQIDHIFPVRIYVRYKLVQLMDRVGDDDRESAERARTVLDRAYNETANLLLCCMKCNTGEQQSMPTDAGLRAARERVTDSDLAARLESLRVVLRSISELSADLRSFVMNGADWPTTRVSLRSSPYGVAMSRTKRRLSNIHNLVVEKLGAGSRPQWTVTTATLQGTQRTTEFHNEEGRLCFYCLGLFKKQAFQIDHINPQVNRSESVQNYNDPTNLIPVCRTCNTVKGSGGLSTIFLDTQITRRQTEGLPGVENATGTTIPPSYLSYLAYAKVQRLRVLRY